MVETLGPPEQAALADQIGCIIMPAINHHIELGTPSWYARFLAQVLVEPQLREHAITTYSRSRSLCRLKDLGHLDWSTPPRGPVIQLHTVIQHLSVHMCAELETDLAVTPPSTRQLNPPGVCSAATSPKPSAAWSPP